jgi:hypothetical protein
MILVDNYVVSCLRQCHSTVKVFYLEQSVYLFQSVMSFHENMKEYIFYVYL